MNKQTAPCLLIFFKGMILVNTEELKNIYQSTEDFHNSVLCSLYKLDDGAARVKRRKRAAVRLAVVCAAAAVLGSVTAVGASTGFFGLVKEDVGKYGVNVRVQTDPEVTDVSAKRIEHAKLKIGYMTAGYSVVPNTDGLKYHDENGEAGFSFIILPSDEFEAEEEYITDSEESTVNGNRLVVLTRQMVEGEDSAAYIAYEYFEAEGWIVTCFAHNGAEKDELIKIMEKVSLEEDTGFVPEPEEETLSAEELELKQRRAEYKLEEKDIINVFKPGDSFDWSKYSEVEDGADFSYKITSIEERFDSSGLDYDGFIYNGDVEMSYENYFDENGSFINTVTRRDVDEGDGINSQDRMWNTEDTRHFYLVKVEVTSHVEPSSDDSYDNWYDRALETVPLIKDGGMLKRAWYYDSEAGVSKNSGIYGNSNVVYTTGWDNFDLTEIKKGETREFTYGIVVDDDVLDSTYLTFVARDDKLSDAYETIYYYSYYNCVKLKD